MPADRARKTIVALSAAVLALCAPLPRPPSAAADAQGFLDDVNDLGFYHADGPSSLVSAGYTICQMLGLPGVVADDVVFEVYVNTGYDITLLDAQMLVAAAVDNLCPEYGTPSRRAA